MLRVKKFNMEKNQEHSLSKSKNVCKELMNTSFDTEDASVKSLMEKGFTCEQATSWLRKIHIDKLFNEGG